MTHWNAFVANLDMHGHGTFFDPRLDNAAQFPIAAENHFGHVTSKPDLITPKLPALHFYQLALPAPAPPAGSFDADAAERGDDLFSGKAKCASCHTDELYSEPGWDMHTGEEVGVDDFQADRGPDHRYRTSPLKALWTHTKGGFYHDGRFATLLDVVAHYDSVFTLGLNDAEKHDLVEYLKSLGDDVPPSVVRPGTLNASVEALGEVDAARTAAPRLSIWPSPALAGQDVHVDLALAAGATKPKDLELAVYDLAGRRVGTERSATGVNGLVWSGRDASGRSVAPGVYFVRISAPSVGLNQERRIVIR